MGRLQTSPGGCSEGAANRGGADLGHLYFKLFAATGVVLVAYWLALVVLHFRIRAVGRGGMSQFGEVKILSARPHEQVQMLKFLFIGTHDDAVVRVLRAGAMGLLVLGLVLFAVLLAVQVAG
jgi:hypothetical protein